ncbi:hypothetical protein HMPREF0663_12048 [Hoylesella oralis ATCC 33269]|uniref:Uncharacterized protein n=1 Tax=Hoylesella oralis ATCC 33269 TaxID=873533 RepID=E7RTH5_9BACT|nr:hypothetical protein HMPREF0663_12048 [Hoylesella oralis ATCC 33269]
MLNAEPLQTPRQTTADLQNLCKRHGKRRDEKQEICFNHLIKKKNLLWQTKVKSFRLAVFTCRLINSSRRS